MSVLNFVNARSHRSFVSSSGSPLISLIRYFRGSMGAVKEIHSECVSAYF
uniref:Uncharacterized protein n=1 Tax=Octopus bimaculoides TaxID=37653 RepID=A0A0L8HX67_OCTBM